MRWFLVVALLLLLSCCVQEGGKPETPVQTTPESVPTTPITTPSKEKRLEQTVPLKDSEKISDYYLLHLKPWKLAKGTEKSDFYTSEIPRKPKVAKIMNVTANLKEELATPVIEDFVFLIDSYRVYAYKEELLWSFNIQESLDKDIKAYGIGDYLFVGTSSGKKGFSLIAFEKENGKIAWHKEINIAGSVSALVVSDLVCIGTDYLDPWVMCFTQGGELKWRAKIDGTVNGFAVGNGKLFVSANKLYAFDLQSGKLLWQVDKGYSAPIFKNNMIFVSLQGYVYAFSENGEQLWKKYFGAGEDQNYNPMISASSHYLYISRAIGKEPFDLQIADFDGNLVGTFNLSANEVPGFPVVSDNVVILPVKTESYGKIYILWRGLEKLFELKHDGKEVLMPKVAVSKGTIYVVFSDNRSSHKLYVLSDSKAPEIVSIDIQTEGDEITVSTTIKDSESAISRVYLVYSFESGKWNYKDMELGRRYIREPIGGYGLSDELYTAKLKVSKSVEFYIAAIDNSNNVAYSKVYAYALT
ncbi:MAG: PQQ-binding-like beta-propeller repeat protein [Archaeoglobaceae archaeon]|nr:PQQ-binding-like beta-propeller repeat protein [Archaeoglobaceae archaeon]MDW8118539.1 PQQ-binding-like beta-propeller repeat protein [Archaeoglobaceae archaeon]